MSPHTLFLLLTLIPIAVQAAELPTQDHERPPALNAIAARTATAQPPSVLPAPPPPATAARPTLPIVAGALVDLPDADGSRDNPFGFGAGLRHNFASDAAMTPYIGLDAGLQHRTDDPASIRNPFHDPVLQPQVGVRAGMTYPVGRGFDLGVASGLYYQSNTLMPDQDSGNTPALSPIPDGERLVVPFSVRGRMRF